MGKKREYLKQNKQLQPLMLHREQLHTLAFGWMPELPWPTMDNAQTYRISGDMP